MSNNPFNQGRNSMNMEMLKNYRTSPLIKYSVSFFCGLLSFIILIIFVGTTSPHFPRNNNGYVPHFNLNYGIL